MLYFIDSGPSDAPVIVLLPGGGMSGWSWKPQVNRLSEYHCIIPDLPGHGRTPAKGPIRISTAAEEVAKLIQETVPAGRAHVVGLSMGGQTALQLLSTHPELVDHVIVSGTNTSPSNTVPLLSPLLKLVMILYAPIQNTDYMINSNMDQLKIPPEYESEFRGDTRLMTPDFYTQLIVESMTFHLPPIVDASGLLVACGEKEPELIKKSARIIRGEHPGVPCVVASSVGHNWSMEKPDIFASMIRSWVENTPLPKELNQLS